MLRLSRWRDNQREKLNLSETKALVQNHYVVLSKIRFGNDRNF